VLDGIAFFHNAFPGKIQLSAVLLRWHQSPIEYLTKRLQIYQAKDSNYNITT
jgi:hypothetical protein